MSEATHGLGDRIKRYERVSDLYLTPNSCAVIRVDGKAFHTYTRDPAFDDAAPFSRRIQTAMIYAAELTAREMSGFKLAYVQSDECTFLLTDFDTHQTEGWFGYRHSKLVSVTAALFTAAFNQHVSGLSRRPRRLAVFDARAFSVPLADAPNVFVWRQRDWERNSLQMLARHHYSAKQLHGKGRADLHEMLHDVGVNWADLPWIDKNGVYLTVDEVQNKVGKWPVLLTEKLTYDEILALVTPTVES